MSCRNRRGRGYGSEPRAAFIHAAFDILAMLGPPEAVADAKREEYRQQGQRILDGIGEMLEAADGGKISHESQA